MMMTMDGRNKKIPQRMIRFLNKKNNSNKSMASRHYKVLAILSKKETIKMFTPHLVKTTKVSMENHKKNKRLRFQRKLMRTSGLHKNGSKSGKRLCFCQTLKPASLIHITKRWLLGTNLLKKMAATPQTK